MHKLMESHIFGARSLFAVLSPPNYIMARDFGLFWLVHFHDFGARQIATNVAEERLNNMSQSIKVAVFSSRYSQVHYKD